MLDSWRRHPGIFAVTVISVSAIAVALVSLFSARAAGPFTISPAQGLYTGGDTITITGNGFGDPALKFTSESYIGKEDLMVQLDAIQNQRGTPVAPATNSGASINITDNSSSYYWHDLACDRTTNSITYTNVYANTTCEDFLFWSTSGNPATWVRTSNGGPIVLHFTGNQVAKMVNTFNMGTTGVTPPTPPGGGNGLWNATDGTARSKMTTEISVKQNAATTTAAAVLFEFGAAYNSNPGYRMILGASTNSAATPTYNGGNCYGSTGNNIRTGTWTCANDTNWKNFAGIFTRSTASANGYTNTYWLNGSLAVTSSTSTTALAAPNSADFFIGARSMTSGSTGTARFNGDIRSYRMYRRTLTEQELKCNMWVDQARYEGTAISGTNIDGCKTGASNISGTGITFFNAPTVTIGGQTCTVKDYTATSITCVTPANAPGQYNVVVTPAAATGLPVQTYPNGFRYTSDLFEYDIQNTGVSPYTYRIDPSTLRLSLSYTHAALITISYPRTASDNSATVMTRGVTMANSTVTTVVGGQCGGVACMTTSISITGSAANINGANGLENFLKGLQWSGGGGYLRGEIRISIMPEDVVFWIDGDGNKHFYQLLNGGSNFSWTDAYNFAKTKTFHGLTGYLMSMVNQDEADLIKT
ncbi:IPT/TIG domain-containing protein, partial [Candidatus Saccharibacteria bacterium]|nr:IPT/TIG domain-containing protein [Candidatus Saccharibacteria bacterium]